MPIDGGHPTVNFSGLASGLDSANIIKAMMQAAHIPIDNLQAREELVKVHQSIYNKMASLLQTLGSVSQSMKSADKFMQLAATSSNASAVAATAGTGVAAGNYAVVVNALAQAQKTYSNAFSSKDAGGLLGTGSIAVQVGSNNAFNIDVDVSTTLQDVADAINGASIGAAANIVFDGENYRLVVTGSQTGAQNAITFTDETSGLGFEEAGNTVQAARDASVMIDGVVHATSATNTLADAIPGVTLQLQQASSAPVSITVGMDADAILKTVQAFVGAYDGVMQAINADATYGGTVDPRKLVGDPTLQNLVRQMQHIVTSPLGDKDDAMQALSQLGITTQSDGTLAINEDKLKAAFVADPAGLAAIFTGGDNNTLGLAGAMGALCDDYAMSGVGVLARMSASMDKQSRDIEMRIAGMEDNLALYEQNLQQQFYNLEQMVSKLKSQGAYLERNLNSNTHER